MKFRRLALVLALIFAAAVLFPLRRARNAFGNYAATTGFSNAPRVTLRRRPGGPRPDLRRQVTQSLAEANPSQSRAKATDSLGRRSRRVSGPQRRLAEPASALAAGGSRPALTDSAPTGHSGHTVVDSADERMVDCVVTVPTLDPLDTPVLPDACVVATQAVGEIPVPPPKSRA